MGWPSHITCKLANPPHAERVDSDAALLLDLSDGGLQDVFSDLHFAAKSVPLAPHVHVTPFPPTQQHLVPLPDKHQRKVFLFFTTSHRIITLKSVQWKKFNLFCRKSLMLRYVFCVFQNLYAVYKTFT